MIQTHSKAGDELSAPQMSCSKALRGRRSGVKCVADVDGGGDDEIGGVLC